MQPGENKDCRNGGNDFQKKAVFSFGSSLPIMEIIWFVIFFLVKLTGVTKPLVCVHACMRAHPHTCECGDFCALRCGRCFKNVRAGACVYCFFDRDMCGRGQTCAARPHVHFLFFFHIKSLKSTKFSQKIIQKKKIFFFLNVRVRVCVRVQKMVCGCVRHTLSKCVRCACGCGRKSVHTKGLGVTSCLLQFDRNVFC